MTPEERWTKIENAIQALLGSQAHHEAEIAENRGQILETARQLTETRKQVSDVSKQIATIGQQMERKTSQIDAQIEKNTSAIRDLIVVSRPVIDAQQTTEKHIERIHSDMALMHSDLKAELELLIKAVNAFVKGFQKPNGSQ